MRKTVRAVATPTVFLGIAILLVGASLTIASFSYETAKADANDLSFYQPSITSAPYPLTSAKRVKNVIFCIGDGMGISQVAMASGAVDGPGGKLYIERLPVSGLVRTYSANSRVTDSAAGGTALACGIKTNNGMLGMAPNAQKYVSILEAAKAKGMATGLVVTCTMTHATPASFASHVKSRSSEPQIAEQLIANKVDVLFGGGRKYFLPKSDPNSGRKDEIDVLAQAKEAGYTYIQTLDELRSVTDAPVLGLFQLDALKTVGPEPSLAFMTRKAIRLLRHVNLNSQDGKSGFFLMVEGSQIDWECHANNAPGSIRQTLLFDQAVEQAIDFAQRDGHTLVIVTADHETGGLTLLGGGNESKGDTSLVAKWSTKSHSGTPVGIWALGPGADRFEGVQNNTEIPAKIAQLLGIRPFPQQAK